MPEAYEKGRATPLCPARCWARTLADRTRAPAKAPKHTKQEWKTNYVLATAKGLQSDGRKVFLTLDFGWFALQNDGKKMQTGKNDGFSQHNLQNRLLHGAVHERVHLYVRKIPRSRSVRQSNFPFYFATG